MKTIHFIAGLPRSGSTLLANVLKQNPDVHAEAVSSLSSVFANIHVNWMNIEANKEYPNLEAKKGVLKSVLQGFYEHIEKPVVLDKDRNWVMLIPVLEEVLQRQVKVLVCVRNPAEILTSFERIRRENPLVPTNADCDLGPRTNVASRAYYYAAPEGALGLAHRNLKDAVTMGYLDRMLFLDYSTLCAKPKSQMKRVYDFLELSQFSHDFDKIEQSEKYNDLALGLPGLHRVRPELSKVTVNCVEYLGLELYEQYNREIFWNAWI